MNTRSSIPQAILGSLALALVMFTVLVADAGEKERQLWKHSDGYFVKLKGDRWQERGSKDDGKFNFVETKRTEGFVELFDKSRGVVVHLRNNVALYKDEKGEKFTKLYDGKWAD